MSIIFFDGFDFYSGFGPGGRKWDAGSNGGMITGRFTGQAIQTGFNPGTNKTFPSAHSQLIVGFAQKINGFNEPFGNFESPYRPFLTFYDGSTAQCSLRFDPSTTEIVARTSTGLNGTDFDLLRTGFVPPLTLWYYIEVKVAIGNPGSIEVRINGQTVGASSGNTQQSGNAWTNKISLGSTNSAGGGVQGGSWACDDLYVINPLDATGNVDYLGEVRVQTKYPDGEGYQDDFQPATPGVLNANEVNTAVIAYSEFGKYNYSGTVGAKDLYSIGNFTVSGEIFAVQENISFRKDDVGNRNVAMLLRTDSVEFEGGNLPCYSSYTYGGYMWEVNPNTGSPWILTDLNQAEFGVTVKS